MFLLFDHELVHVEQHYLEIILNLNYIHCQHCSDLHRHDPIYKQTNKQKILTNNDNFQCQQQKHIPYT